jgi:xanthine permease
MNKKSGNSVYELDGMPPLKTAIPLGIQHVLAMFVGNVAPLIIISNALGLPVSEKTFLIQCAMFVAGVATLIQCYPIGPIGARLPIVMGTSFAFVPTSLIIGAKYGMEGILGASLVAAIVQIAVGVSLKHLKKFLPPLVTGTVVLSIGLSLLPVGINYFAGGVGSSDFGSSSNLLLGTIVLVTIIFFKQFTKGLTSISSILIGLVIGYIVAIPMGKIDFSEVMMASWISIPTPFKYGFEFHLDAILPMAFLYIVSALESIGNISAITKGGADREPSAKEISGGIIADAVDSIIGAVFNVPPNTCFGQNAGIIAMTKVINRFVVAIGGVFLILAGIFPKLGTIVALMPPSVLGGAAVMMFGMISISGINLIMSEPLGERNSVIVALSLGVGVGLSQVPGALEKMPHIIQLVFGESGIVLVALIAIVLNIVLPKDKEEQLKDVANF